MTTQAERLTSRRDTRVFGLAYLTKLAAWIELKRQAHRVRRHEAELRDMLKEMSPNILDDMGVGLDANGEPMLELVKQNARVIITKALGRSSRYHDPY